MSIEALIFDVDGTLADTEEAHRLAFNNAFERFRLGWKWNQDAYRELLKTTGGKERIAAYLATKTMSAAERKRLTELIPAFLTVVLMIFTYNIGVGMTSGMITYVLLKVCTGRSAEVKAGMWVLALLSVSLFVFLPKV